MLRLLCALVSVSWLALAINISPNLVGDGAAATEFAPWMVSLQIEAGDLAYCGAALIDSTSTGKILREEETFTNEKNQVETRIKYTAGCSGWIVTAASCLRGVDTKTIIPTLGNLDLESVDDNATECQVIDTFTFKNANGSVEYNETTNEYDLGLIKVEFNQATLGDYEVAKTLCDHTPALRYWPMLNLNESLYPKIEAMVYGWGLKKEDGPLQKILHNMTLPLHASKECSNFYSTEVFKSKTMICAGGSGKGPCSYDTGGPLICEYKEDTGESATNDTLYLCGITSFGDGCGSKPAIFTNILDIDFQQWIKETINAIK